MPPCCLVPLLNVLSMSSPALRQADSGSYPPREVYYYNIYIYIYTSRGALDRVQTHSPRSVMTVSLSRPPYIPSPSPPPFQYPVFVLGPQHRSVGRGYLTLPVRCLVYVLVTFFLCKSLQRGLCNLSFQFHDPCSLSRISSIFCAGRGYLTLSIGSVGSVVLSMQKPVSSSQPSFSTARCSLSRVSCIFCAGHGYLTLSIGSVGFVVLSVPKPVASSLKS